VTGLIVSTYPGDEITLFGNLVCSRNSVNWSAALVDPDPSKSMSTEQAVGLWKSSCRRMNITPWNVFHFNSIPTERLEAKALEEFPRIDLTQFDLVVIPNILDPSPLRRLVAAGVSLNCETVWMETNIGGKGEFSSVTPENWGKLAAIVNECYGPRLRDSQIAIEDMRGCRQYRQMRGSDVIRFYLQFLSLNTSVVDDANPWDLLTSQYEADRYALELEALSSIEWLSLLECGACVGAFTGQIVSRFPDRIVSACESNPQFARRLDEQLGNKVTVYLQDVEHVSCNCDVLFASSILYYCSSIPESVISCPKKYLVVSHIKTYHDKTLSPFMERLGWRQVFKSELYPRIEDFCGIPVVKDGTEVAIWQKPDSIQP